VKYAEFLQRTAFSKAELLASAWGTLVEDPPADGLATLPAPPMLMMDRIVEIGHRGAQGRIVAEYDVPLDAWFFQCHFRNDPVQPGCLGVDAIWQLIGFYAAARGAKGSGRALGAKEIEFVGQIRPYNKLVRYEIDIRRYTELADTGAAIAIGSGQVSVDGETIYTVKDAKVGIFRGIRYPDYPLPSANSVGGLMQR
jgi:3-hydroxyacyl-[acyl-carrier protein] dehydratase / trans-2-decenoyl-[acyl-carrier protein] isomerase